MAKDGSDIGEQTDRLQDIFERQASWPNTTARCAPTASIAGRRWSMRTDLDARHRPRVLRTG